MSHELGTPESWQAVMRDLCRWTSKERQAELAANERRVARESRENSLATVRSSSRGADVRRQWNAVRSASRRGVVKGVRERKDFSWETHEREERRYGVSDWEISEDMDWINRQSKTAGK